MGAGASCKKTVIANAFANDIFVSCQGESDPAGARSTISVSLKGIVLSYTKENTAEPDKLPHGIIKICSGHYQEFYPYSSKKVYLTIVYVNKKKEFKEICQRFMIPIDRNVVVTSSGGVQLTKRNSTWIGRDGVDHEIDAVRIQNYRAEAEILTQQYKNGILEAQTRHGIQKPK
ncbi:unnamed protein product [Mytilus coruscus]|uniref:Uncharacterized protein n=1 Tax=Mytilus coruscus TaxID=42192 RepID=A0A6J8B5L4_MYTCO|nr:unnamed protein product [Mytilus coruscus]